MHLTLSDDIIIPLHSLIQQSQENRVSKTSVACFCKLVDGYKPKEIVNNRMIPNITTESIYFSYLKNLYIKLGIEITNDLLIDVDQCVKILIVYIQSMPYSPINVKFLEYFEYNAYYFNKHELANLSIAA